MVVWNLGVFLYIYALNPIDKVKWLINFRLTKEN